MKKTFFLILILLSLIPSIFAQSKGEVGLDETILNQRKQWLETYKKNYPSIFKKSISDNSQLFFLFTYLPISDIISKNEVFFQKQINIANLTREKTSWGKSIPDLLFKQYILNPLIYNETLDSFRLYAHKELFQKVSKLTITDAVVEVGYWCRENIIALHGKPQMGNPLASLNAREVSYLDAVIFQVAAMRSVGIPARLDYVPALAHTDGEFYFIEVWINEKWTIIPVNEPRKILDQTWAKSVLERSLVAYNRCIGNDMFNENTEIKTPFYQIQNIQKQYGFQTKIKITVVDTANKPISNAPVSLMLIKNASIFPFITKPTGSDGSCTFYTGAGLFTAFSAQGNDFSFAFINTNQGNDYTIKLVNHFTTNLNYVFSIVPPAEKYGITKVIPITGEELAKIYTCDTIRRYSKGSKQLILNVISKNKIDKIHEKHLEASGENCSQVGDFIKLNNNSFYFSDFMDVLSPKILYNSSANDLKSMLPSGDNIKTQKGFYSDINYKNYILNPQLANELLTPWRVYFEKTYSELQKKAITDIKTLINHVKNSIILISDEENYSNNPISPIDVDKLKIADKYSRDLYFIALCRTFGIPAQYSYNFDKPLIYDGSDWKTICFETGDVCDEKYNSTIALLEERNPVTTIKYGTNYSFLNYNDNKFKTFQVKKFNKPNDSPREFTLENGLYASTSISRTPSCVTIFNLNFYKMENNVIHGGLFFAHTTENRENYGNIDPKNTIQVNTSPPQSLIKFSENSGSIITYINPAEYASLSAVTEILENYNYYPAWKGNFLIFVPENTLKFIAHYIPTDLPKNITIIEDKQSKVLNYLTSIVHFDFSNYLPAFFIINPQNSVVYFSNSYKTFIMDEFYRILKEYDLLNEIKTNPSSGTLPIFDKNDH